MRNVFDFILGCLSIYFLVEFSDQLFTSLDNGMLSSILIFCVLRLIKVVALWGGDLFGIDLSDGIDIGDIGGGPD